MLFTKEPLVRDLRRLFHDQQRTVNHGLLPLLTWSLTGEDGADSHRRAEKSYSADSEENAVDRRRVRLRQPFGRPMQCACPSWPRTRLLDSEGPFELFRRPKQSQTLHGTAIYAWHTWSVWELVFTNHENHGYCQGVYCSR